MTPSVALADAARTFAAELRRRWRKGAAADAAAALAAHPELACHKSVVVDLAYEEYILREKAGNAPDPESFAARFPAFRAGVRSVLAAHQLLLDRPDLLDPAAGDWPAPGDQIEGVKLEVELGQGAFGRAYLAFDPGTHRPCVVKLTAGRSAEAKVIGPLAHPHVTGVYWARAVGAWTAVCMPFVGVSTLADVIAAAGNAAGGPHPVTADVILAAAESDDLTRELARPPAVVRAGEAYPVGAAAVAARIADAVAYVHGAGVAHGDLKPSNVVVGPGGAPYLIDFNLSTREAGPAGARGTPGYMAPELLDAAADPHAGGVDLARADLFALGVVVYELLTGRPPFPPADPKSFAAQAAAARTPPAPLAAVYSPDVAAALAACLSPDPAARPASATVLAEALDRFVDSERNPAPEPAPAVAARRPARGLGRRRVAAAAAGVVLVAAVGALRERLLRPDAPPVLPEEKPAVPAPPPGPAVPIAFRPPETAQEFFDRGWASMKAGDWTGARADFLTSDRRRKNPWAVALAAYCATAGGSHKESVGYARLLIGEVAVPPEVLNNLGYALAQGGRAEDAVGTLDQVPVGEFGMPAARYNRAVALYLIGHGRGGLVDPRAAGDIRAALAAGFSSPTIHFEAAQIYAACGDQSPVLRADARAQIRAAIGAGRLPSQCRNDATLRGRLRTGFGSTIAFEAACAAPQGTQPARLPQLRLVEPRAF